MSMFEPQVKKKNGVRKDKDDPVQFLREIAGACVEVVQSDVAWLRARFKK